MGKIWNLDNFLNVYWERICQKIHSNHPKSKFQYLEALSSSEKKLRPTKPRSKKCEEKQDIITPYVLRNLPCVSKII